ncbi:chaperonin 10-like protein [Crassisporium funariophilum]|nr:chaperonin 10-like protein [Crassisporium funariophilum]
MPSTQKALLLDAKFGKFVLENLPIPKPGPGEVLVKVKAASLNPVDWKIQKYGIFVENYPAVIGTDIAGDIEELGEGVTEFKKGDRVFFQGQFGNDYAGFQQYAKGLAVTTARIPSNISYDQASALPVALTAAYVGLYNINPYGLGFETPVSANARGKYAGTPIVILGGASSVGQFGLQLAKLSGFSPIITTASSKNSEYVKSLGATHVFDRNISASSLSSEISKITSAPITAVLDTISGEDTQQLGYDILASGGQLGVVLPPSAKTVKDKTIVNIVGVLRLDSNIPLLETLYHDKIAALLEEGLIKPNAIEVLPGGLAGITDGLQRLVNNEVSKLKLVAHPQETA